VVTDAPGPPRGDGLTHFDAEGRARMVDVSAKSATERRAVAAGRIEMRAQTLQIVREGTAKKGDVIAVAELAGVMAAKRTADLIPLCHPLPLTSVTVKIAPAPSGSALEVTARVKTTGPTGVEMEALTAVSTACLTVYDMLKAVDRGMRIGDIVLMEKSGGASGDYRRGDD